MTNVSVYYRTVFKCNVRICRMLLELSSRSLSAN
jgi:hypothetical protein